MMIEPVGWIRKEKIDELCLYHPADHSAAQIRYRWRVRPLRSLKAVGDAAWLDTAWRDRQELQRQLLYTMEGEFACHAELAGSSKTGPVQLHLGIVLGDDFYDVLEMKVWQPALLPEMGSLARSLIKNISLGLGVRRRRFWYTPPPSWQGFPRELAARWFPPDYPADRTCLTVFPASPLTLSPESIWEGWLAEQRAAGSLVQREPVQDITLGAAEHGIKGSLWSVTLSGSPGALAERRELALIGSAPYLYAFLLETASGDKAVQHHAVLRALVASARVLPAAEKIGSARWAYDMSSCLHWAE